MEIKDITFSYGDKINRLHQISGEIEIGKITTIIGPNGCGKSTLLGVMSSNYLPQQGHVLLDGKKIGDYKPKELARKLAVVHQQNGAPLDMTVERLTAFGRLPHRNMFSSLSDQDEEAIEWALSCTNLQDKRHITLDSLSGGEKQRVWIAMALAQNSQFLFLDEPTTYLDIYYQYEILDLIKRLNLEHGLSIVMVLHDINQAIQYSDTIIVMKDGKLVIKGRPEEVISEQLIADIYGIEVIVKSDVRTGLYIVPIKS
ncbi:ABC transporter ATP-binding protein [Bacillus sp. FJAT-49711]|uniref:ABC transporter ATP-binding protein n=1 Tax=Bacillus sp. FJAT-49711 TaxID=2833585 RepID=UPI001BC9531E|nr:ABC transporter ATP-binding protein [Bacillus sp. FJAT-49711]MBS4218507.1 ABC transporter ATP-binding protein [Bacillus sp. FJAT-49711]